MERDWLHKLSGIVEMDEFCCGSGNSDKKDVSAEAGEEPGKRGRGTEKAAVVAAVPLSGGKPECMKMELAGNLKKEAFEAFAESNIDKGSTVPSDGFASCKALKGGYALDQKKFGPIEEPERLRWTHMIISNFKALAAGTYHGLGKKRLQPCLAEFCWRMNRRFSPFEKFDRLAQACVRAEKIPYKELVMQGVM
jgi:hypothetical protein